LVPAVAVAIALAGLMTSGHISGFGSVEPNCSAPTYEPGGRSWDQLQPAVVVQSSDGCVGYCFNAIVDSESEENERVARVVVLGEDGALTRGIVDRRRVVGGAAMAAEDGEPVRFACFDSFADGAAAPRFESCVQMAAFEAEDPACAAEPEAISDARTYEEQQPHPRWRSPSGLRLSASCGSAKR
jgi:hypothetical protein